MFVFPSSHTLTYDRYLEFILSIDEGIFILLMMWDMYGNALMHLLKNPELHYEIGGDWKQYCTL